MISIRAKIQMKYRTNRIVNDYKERIRMKLGKRRILLPE